MPETRQSAYLRLTAKSRTVQGAMLIDDNSLSAVFLRVYLWLVPVAMLIAAVVFGALAATDERWLLFGVMVLLAFMAVGLGVAHWWLLYRFGKRVEQGARSKEMRDSEQ